MSIDGLHPLQRFVLRNWELLDHDRLAVFLGFDRKTLSDIAGSLGLSETGIVPPDRAIPLVMRRNHDLLPESEIARLLGMDLEELREVCLEMDFLDIKLGARPSTYPDLTADELELEAGATKFHSFCGMQIKDYSSWDKPFSFLDALRTPEQTTHINKGDLHPQLRMMYSYTAAHGDFLLSGDQFYTDGVLSRLANRGVNAGWMPALLRNMAPSGVFPEFGNGDEKRIESLRREVESAAKYGISIYLYLNEPRFTDESFFERHPSAKGVPAHTQGQFGMCTSDPDVRTWLYESAKFIFENVPGLGGVVLITASENQTNCYSRCFGQAHPDGFTFAESAPYCTRCIKRGPEAVLGDTASIISQAADDSDTGARVIQWLWGWDLGVAIERMELALSLLPDNVEIMVDWAKNTRFSVCGVEAVIGEYTLAHVRPSDYARRIIHAAKASGRKVHARCNIVTTCEMIAQPYFPVMKNAETLLRGLREEEMDGVLGCWIFGAYPGRNMEMLAHTGTSSSLPTLAAKYYGHGADMAVKAWELFSKAVTYYPTTVPVLYLSAIGPGPGLRFSLKPEPWRKGMALMAAEDLDAASNPFGSDVVIRGFRAMSEMWKEGLSYLEEAVQQCDVPDHQDDNARDLRISKACLSHFITCANYAEFILLRNRWLADLTDATAQTMLLHVLKDELQNAEQMLEIARHDSRMGYEGSVGYFYTPIDILEKIYDLKAGIERVS